MVLPKGTLLTSNSNLAAILPTNADAFVATYALWSTTRTYNFPTLSISTTSGSAGMVSAAIDSLSNIDTRDARYATGDATRSIALGNAAGACETESHAADWEGTNLIGATKEFGSKSVSPTEV
jgi:hypothetical protein